MLRTVSRRSILAAALLLAGVAVLSRASTFEDEAPDKPTLVFVVRHAEKAENDPRDPDLSDEGRKRATSLARMLRNAGVTHLFATELKRTRQTVQPLSVVAKVPVETVGARKTEEQIEALKQLPAGSVAVVAGHSNTVPAIVTGLGGTVENVKNTQYGKMLDESEYGRLFLVVIPASGSRQSIELAY